MLPVANLCRRRRSSRMTSSWTWLTPSWPPTIRTRTGTSTTLNSFKPNKQHKLAKLKLRSKSQVTNFSHKQHIFYSFPLHNFIPNFIHFFTDVPRLCLVLSKDLPKQFCIYNNNTRDHSFWTATTARTKFLKGLVNLERVAMFIAVNRIELFCFKSLVFLLNTWTKFYFVFLQWTNMIGDNFRIRGCNF